MKNLSDQPEHIQTLVTAFRALDSKQRARLRWHLEKGTPICRGLDSSWYWKDGAG